MAIASVRPGLGAIPFKDGGGSATTFRVWAPFAQTAQVKGNFNALPIDLASEGNGYWSADVPAATRGHEYRFIVNGVSKIDPRARHVTNSIGNGIIEEAAYDWKINDFQAPPWNEMVIYEMHIGTFPDKRTPAANLLEAVANDFWYLRDLGVNTILLLPMAEFPGDISWGYNPAHIFSVEQAYGGPAALKTFIDKAHENGLAVLLDVVYNHLGPNDLPTWQFDGWFQNWSGEDMGGIYFYNDWRANTPWGRKNRPDYGRPQIREFIRDNALMWLEEFRFDGLRFDMTVFVRNVYGNNNDDPNNPDNLDGWGSNLLRWINDEINVAQPWKITIAEDMQNNPRITRDTPNGGLGFDSQWDADFVHGIRDVLTATSDESRDIGRVAFLLERLYNGEALERVVYTESHDEVASRNGKRRLTEDIYPGNADSWFSKKRSTLGAALVLTAPGIPMIFQAQEILEWRPFEDVNGVDWDKYDRFRGIFTLYRDLIRLRRNWFNNTRGLRGRNINVFHKGFDDKVLAYHRWADGGPGDDVVVVLNLSNRGYDSYRIGFPRSGRWWVRFNSDFNGYSPDFQNFSSYDTDADGGPMHNLPYSGNVGIGPYTAIILSQ